jgi:hypothetical protein
VYNKPEKYGARMAALEHHLEKWQRFSRLREALVIVDRFHLNASAGEGRSER